MKKKINQFDPTTLPEKQLLVYGIIQAHEGIRIPEISSMLGFTVNSVDYSIKVLQKKGIIEFRGSNRSGGYFILK